MTTPISRAIALCGTEQPDVPGRMLKAGPMSVEFDNGQLRYLKVSGVEVLRAVGFLVRDENWGTYTPEISESEDRPARRRLFGVLPRRMQPGRDQEIAYDAKIEGTPDGNLEFDRHRRAEDRFPDRAHRLRRAASAQGRGRVPGRGRARRRQDGEAASSRSWSIRSSPLLDIRALTHEVMPGLKATVRMEGDTFEMEDHRNWTDASFKTYVRPLALPWPYTLKAGEAVKQSIKVTLSGTAPEAQRRRPAKASKSSSAPCPATRCRRWAWACRRKRSITRSGSLGLLKLAAPRFLICHFDPRQKHGLKELYGYRVLCEQTGADAVLEVVVESVDQLQEGTAAARGHGQAVRAQARRDRRVCRWAT